MSSEAAFLQAIQEDPDDDLPRQVLADWLDDHSEPDRAEFIRVQLELARGVAGPALRSRLLDREAELLRAHAGRWMGPFAEDDTPIFRYERGTASVQMPIWSLLQERVLAQAAEWFPRGWVLELSLHHGNANFAQLFDQPWLGQLYRLTLDGAGLWGGVRVVERLVRCPALVGLTALSLCDSWLTPEEVAALDTGLPRLRRLNLSNNRVQQPHIQALVRLERLKDLVSLQLVGPDQHVAGSSLTGAEVELLVSSPRLAGLQELNLSHSQLLRRGAEAIAASPHLANLRRLGLRNAELTGHGAAGLARSAHLNCLELLDVWDSRAGRSGFDRLRQRFGSALWMKPEEPPCWAKG